MRPVLSILIAGIIYALIALAPGCNALSWRVGQKKVPPPVLKGLEVTEFERRAAKLIADQIKEPKELKPVAQALSQSLGEPEKAIPVAKPEDLPKAAQISTDELQKGILIMQKQLADINKKLTALQGKEIEGTGFNLFGPSMSLIIVGLIILGVIFPPLFTVLLIVFRRLKAAASIVTKQIEEAEYGDDAQLKAGVEKLKAKIGNVMDSLPNKTAELHKKTIKKLKVA